MTDISISDIERISHADLDRKIEQLTFYINRVSQRVSALNNFMKPLSDERVKKINKRVEKLNKSQTIRAKR
jgi:hypothetical protein